MLLQITTLLLVATTKAAYRAPALFVNHGPGSVPYFQPNNPDVVPLIENWKQATKDALFSGGGTPRAILVVNAHWEESTVTISSYDSPPSLFDDLGPS
jgi:aromatic ring-opening dioxygenase catalytic subunit (LigB family)